jgi:hypothetical protein
MTLEEGELSWAVALEGRAELGCPSTDGADPSSDEMSFPAAKPYVKSATPPRVVVTDQVTFEQFSESVLSFTTKTGGEGSLSLVSGTIDGKPHLVAGVAGVATCGEQWVSVVPEVDGGELTLRATEPSRVDPKVIEWLKVRARTALPDALARLAHKAEQASVLGLDAAQAELAQRGLQLEMD